jgi:hypothetical protein
MQPATCEGKNSLQQHGFRGASAYDFVVSHGLSPEEIKTCFLVLAILQKH